MPRPAATLAALLMALLLPFAALPAQAGLRQFGGVIYPVPPGWGEPRGGDHASMWADLPDDRCEYCRIHIGPEAPAAGAIARWLERNRTAFLDEDEHEDFEVVEPAAATTLGRREAALLVQSDGTDVQFLVAIAAGDRFHLFGFQGDAGDPEELAETSAVMSGAFLPWLNLVRFSAEGAPDLLPAPVAGDLDGLWGGLRIDFVMGMDLVTRSQNSYRRIVFWPDGGFYEGTPPDGMRAPDRAALKAARDTDWGNYRRDGDRLALNFADGRTETLEREGEGWAGDGYTLHRVEPLADGSRLDGSISWLNYTGFSPGSGITGGAGGGGETVFAPDGRYGGSRFHSSTGSFDGGGGFAISGGGDDDAGRYVIADGLVRFQPKAGAQARPAELVFRSGDEVMIGDDFLDGRVLPPG